MTAKKARRRPPRPRPPQTTEPAEPAEPAEPRRSRLPFGSALFGGGPSVMPGITRSFGRGLLTVCTAPALLAVAIVVPLLVWLALLAFGFEGSPARLVDVLALPPISTYFDLGTGASLVGLGTGFLVYTAIAITIRAILFALLTGLIVDALEGGRVTTYGLVRGARAIPTVLVVQVLAFSMIVAGNTVLPILGPGIGFLAFVAALVGGLFFLGFAPAAAVRQGRPAVESVRRSGRAAMLPGSKHLAFCALYFFVALPVVVMFAPGGSEITANPSLLAWVFILAANVIHLAFMAALAYRWIVAEPSVPEEPVRRRQPATRSLSGRSRSRR